MTTTEFDPAADDMPSVAVVRTVAGEVGLPIGELDCVLQDVIDTKALNRLFSATPDGLSRTSSDAFVEFSFCGCDVTVYGHGHLVVTETASGTGP